MHACVRAGTAAGAWWRERPERHRCTDDALMQAIHTSMAITASKVCTVRIADVLITAPSYMGPHLGGSSPQYNPRIVIAAWGQYIQPGFHLHVCSRERNNIPPTSIYLSSHNHKLT